MSKLKNPLTFSPFVPVLCETESQDEEIQKILSENKTSQTIYRNHSVEAKNNKTLKAFPNYLFEAKNNKTLKAFPNYLFAETTCIPGLHRL